MEVNLRDKFGQMIMLGLDVNEINDEVISLIKDYKIGGVVLYKKNYYDMKSMVNLINKLKKINKENIPLFIAIDQENGRVNRLPNEIMRIYNPLRQAMSKDIEVINECNEITSNILSMVGVNMNFAPVLDINYDNKVIGNRSYGYNKQDVIKYGLPIIKTMKDKGIISVVKHFPGHGLVMEDSHYLIPTIKDVDKMENDLDVYGEAIKSGCDAIMVGHLKVRGYGNKPATINREIIDKYLINRYNYHGLIITDDLRMNTMKYMYGMKNLIIKSINSGCNVLMIKYKKNDIRKIYSQLYDMVDKIDINLINNSYSKIIDIKNKYQISNNIADIYIDINDINEKINKINEKM